MSGKSWVKSTFTKKLTSSGKRKVRKKMSDHNIILNRKKWCYWHFPPSRSSLYRYNKRIFKLPSSIQVLNNERVQRCTHTILIITGLTQYAKPNPSTTLGLLLLTRHHHLSPFSCHVSPTILLVQYLVRLVLKDLDFCFSDMDVSMHVVFEN